MRRRGCRWRLASDQVASSPPDGTAGSAPRNNPEFHARVCQLYAPFRIIRIAGEDLGPSGRYTQRPVGRQYSIRLETEPVTSSPGRCWIRMRQRLQARIHLILEDVALRHQLMVCERGRTPRRSLSGSHRLLWPFLAPVLVELAEGARYLPTRDRDPLAARALVATPTPSAKTATRAPAHRPSATGLIPQIARENRRWGSASPWRTPAPWLPGQQLDRPALPRNSAAAATHQAPPIVPPSPRPLRPSTVRDLNLARPDAAA